MRNDNGDTEAGEHLRDMNQPKTLSEEDARSLDDDELFDDLEGKPPPSEKPLLAAC